ncbi:hypothetical protein [Stappia sp.]|jgi:hypothetical protein|uniref:hypothetical protein n=1 Tax=Stappia sp. TaxID=1870903 RepID=UPI003D0CA989
MKSSLPLLVAGLALLAGACRSTNAYDTLPGEFLILSQCSSEVTGNRFLFSVKTTSGTVDPSNPVPFDELIFTREELRPAETPATGSLTPEQELAEAKEKVKQCYTAKRESGDYRKRPKPS